MTVVMEAACGRSSNAGGELSKMKIRLSAACLVALAWFALDAPPALAHCDTLDGPVITDARIALESRDVTPVLKWVAPPEEAEIREAFAHAIAVRRLGPEARSLADRFFFETLVRIHRQGEGAPYTGLKTAGSELEPGIAGADQALETGSVDGLVGLASAEVAKGLRERHARVVEARKHAGESVDKGRDYVAAYVTFIHYAERLLQDAKGAASHSGPEVAPPAHVH
jgi:Family of unknown function (DUF6448)